MSYDLNTKYGTGLTSPQLYSSLYTPGPTGEYGGSLQQPSMVKGIDEVSAGTGPLTSQDKAPVNNTAGMAQGAMAGMNAGGSAGQTLTGAGVYGLMSGAAMGPYALAGGLALTAIENQKKAEAANEQAKIQEEQQRKAATQNAVTNLITVTRGLGV